MQSHVSLRKVILALFLIITPFVQGGGCNSTGNVKIHHEGSGDVTVDLAFGVTYENIVVTSPRSQVTHHFLNYLPETADDSLTDYIETFLGILQQGVDARVQDNGALKALINIITPYYKTLCIPAMDPAAKLAVRDFLIDDVRKNGSRPAAARRSASAGK